MSIQELAERVKECFHLPFVTVHGDLEKNKIAEKIAISPGLREAWFLMRSVQEQMS